METRKRFDQKTRARQKCKGMEQLIEESEEIVKEDADDDVRDAGLISGRATGWNITKWGIMAPRIPPFG